MRKSKVHLAILLAIPSIGFSNENNNLEEISVIALRDNNAYAKEIYRPTIINKEQLLTTQPNSIAEAVKSVPNIDIQGGSRYLNQTPVIRGLSGNRVVQVIDGVRQNFDLAHRGSYLISPSLIQNIEVIKGPSSTLWGSGALGGVVAMQTANAFDLLKGDDKWGITVRQGYQSASSLSESEAAVFGVTDTVDWLIQGFYNDSDNIRVGNGEKIPYSGLTQKGGLLKLGWQINDENRVGLSYREVISKQLAPTNNDMKTIYPTDELIQSIGQCHKNRATMLDCYKNLLGSMGSAAELARQKITDRSISLNYKFNPDSSYINTDFTIYRNETKEKEDQINNNLQDTTKLTTTGFNLRNSSEFNWLTLTYGVDYYQDKIKTLRQKNDTAAGSFRPESYDAKSNVFGGYLLSYFHFFDDKFIIAPSIRYDNYSSKEKNQGKYSENHWSPSLALLWKTTEWLDLSAHYNEAFRAPSLQERFVSGSHFGYAAAGRRMVNQFIANPNLQPETAKNKELSANFHFDNIFRQQDHAEFTATFFQNDVKNLINLVTFYSNPNSPFNFMPDRSQYQNIADARLRGVELEGKYSTGDVSLVLGYSQVRGKNKTTHQYLENINADKYSAAINYALLKDIFNVGAKVTYYAKQDRVPPQNITYPSYTLTDLTATFSPLSGAWKDLRIDFSIENLFDKQYLPAFNLMEGAGRNVKVGVSYYF